MKVLHLNYYDLVGGAAVAMYRLHTLFKKNNNINSKLLVFEKKINESDTISEDYFLKNHSNFFKRKISFNLTKLQRIYSKQTHSLNIFNSGILKKINKINPDIVHLHWINNEFISIKEIGKIGYPVVWTFYDMWPFCGCEHYTLDNRYLEGYSTNNNPKENNGLDLNKYVWNLKKKYWRHKKFEIVCLSNWLAEQAKNSNLFKNSNIHTIAPPIDFEKWIGLPKSLARNRLNLSEDYFYILFGAANGTGDSRKGFELVIDVVNKFSKNCKNIHLLTFGNARNDDIKKLNVPSTNFGEIKYDDHDKLSLIYSASDISLLPSKIEAFGQVGLESLACKTPIICFEKTGFQDMIEHKKNGYICRYMDQSDLLQGLLWYFNLQSYEKNKINEEARNFVENKFSEKRIISEYSNIYKKLL